MKNETRLKIYVIAYFLCLIAGYYILYIELGWKICLAISLLSQGKTIAEYIDSHY